MQFKRHFTNDKEDIYSNIKFQYTTSEIKNMDGSVVLKQKILKLQTFGHRSLLIFLHKNILEKQVYQLK